MIATERSAKALFHDDSWRASCIQVVQACVCHTRAFKAQRDVQQCCSPSSEHELELSA